MRGGRGESRQTNHKLSFVYETYLAWTQNKSFLVMFLEQKNTPGNSLETPGNSWKLAGKCCPGNSKTLPALEKRLPASDPGTFLETPGNSKSKKNEQI